MNWYINLIKNKSEKIKDIKILFSLIIGKLVKEIVIII